VTVTAGETSVRAVVPIPLDAGLGIHVPQSDHTIAIADVALHLVVVIRHVGMQRTTKKSPTRLLGPS
jgi:hypothetical protein